MLYIVPTPIGNLSEFSERAQLVLKECDYILCEDTRTSYPLLKHFEITTPVKSYHKFNEKAALAPILYDLKQGKEIALITDAGMPAICDPGEMLIEALHEENLPFQVLSGPCSLASAFAAFGQKIFPYQFWGFCPKKEGQLNSFLLKLHEVEGSHFFFASKREVEKVLKWHIHNRPQVILFAAKELSKLHETLLKLPAAELEKALHPIKGEYILGFTTTQSASNPLPLEQAFELLTEKHKLSKQEAVKILSDLYSLSRKELYQKFIL